MLAAVLPWVLGALILAMALAAWRLLRGPGLPDRILALDTLYINTLALLVTLGLVFGHAHFFEVALLIGLLGFIGTVVTAKFLLRGDIAE
ncbi:MAG TPA: K+/H+ antiporter subunit F [Burkholderiaceae bacterium]|nr:K+/H+ antiporter subunit F [Burkholderiaceae bacterium]